MKPTEKPGDQSLRDIFSSLRKGFMQVGFFSLFINLMMLAPPLYMLQVYDRVLTSRSEETLLLLTLLLTWMFVTIGLLEFVRSRMMVRLSGRIDERLSKRLYGSVMHLALYQPERGGTAPLDDLVNIRQFLSGNGTFAFFDAPWVPIYIGILFLFDSMFGMLALFSACLLLVLALFNEISTRRLQRKASEGQTAAARIVEAQTRNAEALKAMAMQRNLEKRWFARHSASLTAQAQASDRAGIWMNLSKTLRLLFQSLMLGLGAYLAINNHITAGMVIAGSIMLGRALAPIDQMISAWKGFISARMSYERIDTLLQEVPAVEKRFSLPRPKGQIEVEKAILIPPGGDVPVVKGISFALRAGEAMAIIGGSAAGKSSLVRALLGVWPLTSGHVRLDGSDIGHWNSEDLGPYVGYLPQDVELFEGTVADNICRFAKRDDRHILKAACVAGVDEMIRALPDGYETAIGPGGVTLSAGQRQRIGLARAVYRRPSVIVLDEPNSNLDQEGERALSGACRYLKRKGVTLILVTHRQSILKHVDKILMMKQGVQHLYGTRDAVLHHLNGTASPRRVARARPHLRVAG